MKRNSTALQLPGETLDVATEIDVFESKRQNLVQRLSSKHKSILIGCTENTENKVKDFSRCNVGNSLHFFIMMIDDSTALQEEEIQHSIMERLVNELSLTYIPRGQSTLMMKCVAEQILRSWLKTFSTYLEVYTLDVEVFMEVEINELKHLGNVRFEGSEEKQSIELNECRTLMMKFVIFVKTMTSNGKPVLWIILLCVNMFKTTFG